MGIFYPHNIFKTEEEMKKIEIQKRYYNSNQLEYVKVPLFLDKEYDHLEINYDYQRFDDKKQEINIIDIGLFDFEDKFRGWSGSNKTTLFISEFYSTPGYQKIKLSVGEWFIALGLYKISDFVDIKITINLFPKIRKWYSCDLHMHTQNSDGQYKTVEVIDFCKKQKLDCIALTDHNNTEQNKEGNSDKDLSIIHGMEYTNYRGHANFFFPEDKIDFTLTPLSNSFDQMRDLFLEMKKQECIISLNHIFDTNCPWLFGFENFPFDAIEIWNGFISGDNMKAINWWHSYISRGKKLPIIGGSDTHKIRPLTTYGSPTTFIFSESKSPNNILNAIKNGNCSITYFVDGPRINFTIGKAYIGEIIAYNENLLGIISINKIKKGNIIVLISNIKKEMQWIVENSGEFNKTFKVEKKIFYRIEVYHSLDGKEMLAALSNPIYIKS